MDHFALQGLLIFVFVLSDFLKQSVNKLTGFVAMTTSTILAPMLTYCRIKVDPMMRRLFFVICLV